MWNNDSFLKSIVINFLKENNLRDQVKIIIGGTSVTQNFADDIGADGYAPDAYGAVDLARLKEVEEVEKARKAI